MELKTAALSLGIGMAAGAAVVLMLPKNSEVYRMAQDVARSVQMEAVKMMHCIKKS